MNPLKSAMAVGVLAASLGATAWGADTLGTKIDDSSLTARIKAALIANPDTKARQIDVDTSNGVVTLRGTVDSQLAKSTAESTAKSIAGVGTVQNELMVKEGTSLASESAAGSSTGLASAAATPSSTGSVSATAEATIPSSSTTVVPSASTSASNGTGASSSADLSSGSGMASSGAPSMSGSMASSTAPSSTSSSTTTTTHSSSTDTVIASAGSPSESSASASAHVAGGVDSSVMQALKSDPRTSSLHVDVTGGSGSGAVVLSGTVSTATERNAAAEVARSVSGVGKVDNKIVVSKRSKAE